MLLPFFFSSLLFSSPPLPFFLLFFLFHTQQCTGRIHGLGNSPGAFWETVKQVPCPLFYLFDPNLAVFNYCSAGMKCRHVNNLSNSYQIIIRYKLLITFPILILRYKNVSTQTYKYTPYMYYFPQDRTDFRQYYLSHQFIFLWFFFPAITTVHCVLFIVIL